MLLLPEPLQLRHISRMSGVNGPLEVITHDLCGVGVWTQTESLLNMEFLFLKLLCSGFTSMHRVVVLLHHPTSAKLQLMDNHAELLLLTPSLFYDLRTVVGTRIFTRSCDAFKSLAVTGRFFISSQGVLCLGSHLCWAPTSRTNSISLHLLTVFLTRDR